MTFTLEELHDFIRSQPPETPLNMDEPRHRNRYGKVTCGCLLVQFGRSRNLYGNARFDKLVNPETGEDLLIPEESSQVYCLINELLDTRPNTFGELQTQLNLSPL